MTTNTPKYRPSFTAEEILELHSYLINIQDAYKSSPLIHSKLLTKIATLTFKLSSGVASAAYINTSVPRIDLLDSIGGTEESTVDPAIKREAIYNLYIEDPSTLSEENIITALDYKDLTLKLPLTPDEKDILDASW